MADFSSTQKMAACWGGFRYRPIMSAALVSKSGSLLAMYRSNRCGLTPALRQIRWTASLEMRNSRASLRTDQWVEPSFGWRRVASSTRACNLGVITVGFRPGCRASVQSGDMVLEEALFPMRDGGRGGLQAPADIGITLAGCQH